MYYYGARYYDPRISIFVSVDPLAALTPNWTPYRYAFNNPIMFRDPTGLFETRKDAKEYRKTNNIEGRIRKNKDGKYSIYGKTTEYTGGDDSDPTLPDSHFNDGVVESLLIDKNSSPFGKKDIYDTVGTELSIFENVTYNSMSIAQKSKFVWDSRKFIEKTVGKKIPLSNSTLYRNTIPKTLKGVGIGMGVISGGMTLYDVYDKQEIRASHVLDATMTAVSFIPGGGWIVGGVYFIGDLGVKAATGQSIGDHLDEFVEEKYNKDNGALVDFK